VTAWRCVICDCDFDEAQARRRRRRAGQPKSHEPDHLGFDSRGPPVARAQAPPDVLDPGPSYDGVDHAFPE